MNIHYVCPGECKGVSFTPGVCQDTSCPLHGKPLLVCDCQDGMHEGIVTPCINCGERCRINGGKGCGSKK